MRTTPQQIIYSTIPPEERTDYLPARGEGSDAPKVFDADDFQLSAGFADADSRSNEAMFELSRGEQVVSKVLPDGPDKPQSKTPGRTKTSDGADVVDSENSDPSTSAGEKAATVDEDLLSIAMQEEREVRKRRGEKIAERQLKQMLVPCSCGAWIRVLEDKAGKVVRCRQCKQPVNVPNIRRKVEKKDDSAAVPKLAVTWVEGIHFFRIQPTSVVLKPGSVADKFIDADVAVTDSRIVVVAFTGGDKKKRGLMGKAPRLDRAEQRKRIRETVAAIGDFNGLPDVEVHSISSEHIAEIRLVQPILKAHESMFAGVPVFGEGRIALFLPIGSGDGQQSFCSQSISTFRTLQELLKKKFSLHLPAAENGVPEADKTDNLICFVNQTRVESIRNLIYYEQDPSFELELSGYRCRACSAVISEEARKKNKLGGANGKGIAKAKCPKCSGKMGNEPLYRVKKAPIADTTSETPEG